MLKQKTMMKIKLLFLCLLLAGPGSYAQTLQTSLTVIDGPVHGIERMGSTLYIGGGFTSVGTPVPYGGIVNKAGNGYLFTRDGARPNGTVRAVVPDGHGGWYIGGDFTQVGGQPRNHIARINADGSLNNWRMDANNSVLSMTLTGNLLYIGGTFTVVGGISRGYLAQINLLSNRPTSWDPDVRGTVNSMSILGNTLYICGRFGVVGGKTRGHLAAITISSGTVNNWNPNPSSQLGQLMNAILADPSTNNIYVGGLFRNINGQLRINFAIIDPFSGTLRGESISLGNEFFGVQSLALATKVISANRNVIYAGFGDTPYSSEVNADPPGMAAINAIKSGFITVHSLDSWNPDIEGAVNTMVVEDNTLYIGGRFDAVGNEVRHRAAAFQISSGNLLPWHPNADGTIYGMAIAGPTMYVGGNFNAIGRLNRYGIASVHAVRGTINTWYPDLGGQNPEYYSFTDHIIYDLKADASRVYVAGRYTFNFHHDGVILEPVDRPLAGVINRNNAEFAWGNPNTGSDADPFYAIDLGSGKAYWAGAEGSGLVGHRKHSIYVRNIVGALTKSTISYANAPIRTLAVANSFILLAGGEFIEMNGERRFYIAAINTNTGGVVPFNPYFNNTVHDIVVDGDIVYIAGDFTDVGGTARNHLAAISLNTGTLTSWNPNADGSVKSLEIGDGVIYAGGSFHNIGGQSRNFAAALSKVDGAATSWNPNPDDEVFAFEQYEDLVYMGGKFREVLGQPRYNYAVLSASDDPLPVTFDKISAVLKQGNLFVNFTSLSETNNSHFIIEASTDGKNFKEIGTLPSAAPGGNSDEPLSYEFSINTNGMDLTGMLGFGLFILLCLISKRNRKLFAGMAVICAFAFVSCKKTMQDMEVGGQDMYIRIVQVDKDGAKTYSQTVKAVNE